MFLVVVVGLGALCFALGFYFVRFLDSVNDRFDLLD